MPLVLSKLSDTLSMKPAVFIKPNNTIKPFVTKHEIETCQSLQQLKHLILLKTSVHDQHHHSNI